jgi:hypothetical protein
MAGRLTNTRRTNANAGDLHTGGRAAGTRARAQDAAWRSGTCSQVPHVIQNIVHLQQHINPCLTGDHELV